VEVRGGVTIPVSGFAGGTAVGEGASAGPVFGVEATLASGSRRTLYAGFSQARFACAEAGCPPGDSYVATGVNLGYRLSILTGTSVIPWLGLGAVTTRVESPGVPGSPEGVSSLGYGGEVGFGLWVATGGSLAFTPALRLAQARTTLPGGHSLTLRHLVADLGLVVVF
jgi:hypothetical protein